MFKLSNKTSYDWTVIVSEPVNDSYKESRFKVSFKIVPQSRIAELTKADQNDSLENQTQLVREMVTGWSDLIGDDGESIPYSDEVKETLIDIPYVRKGILEAFFKSIAGRLPKN